MTPEHWKGAGVLCLGAVGVQLASASAFLNLVILTSSLSSFPTPVQPSQVENYKNNPWKLDTSAGLKDKSSPVLMIFKL